METNWIKRALEITGDFESNHSPWGAVAGNFDGQGLSAGVLQWNLGTGTLQPIIRSIGFPNVLKVMPQERAEALWEACRPTTTVHAAVQLASQWDLAMRHSVSLLMSSPEGQQAQQAASVGIANKAMETATRWNLETRRIGVRFREFAFFFDLRVQQGGMAGIWTREVDIFIGQNRGEAMNRLLAWLGSRKTSEQSGVKDALNNGIAWRRFFDRPPVGLDPQEVDARFRLLVLAYLRASKATFRWQPSCVNRRGIIAIGFGYHEMVAKDLELQLQ